MRLTGAVLPCRRSPRVALPLGVKPMPRKTMPPPAQKHWTREAHGQTQPWHTTRQVPLATSTRTGYTCRHASGGRRSAIRSLADGLGCGQTVVGKPGHLILVTRWPIVQSYLEKRGPSSPLDRPKQRPARMAGLRCPDVPASMSRLRKNNARHCSIPPPSVARWLGDCRQAMVLVNPFSAEASTPNLPFRGVATSVRTPDLGRNLR